MSLSLPQPERSPNACPLCGSVSLVALFERREVPVLLNRLYHSAAAARRAATGRLEVVACHDCGFVFNRAFEPALVDYHAGYENDQGNSPAFSAHRSAMAGRILDFVTDRAKIGVVEIGCGQGQFLNELLERAGGRIATAVGYDPAWRGVGPPGARIEARNFDADALRRLASPIDVIVSRHVIEHLPDPVGFLAGIRAALPPLWRGRLFLETPSLEWIVSGCVLHDFFHEHCNYFASATLRYALERAGFRAETIDPVFDGQYFWVEAAAGRPHTALRQTGKTVALPTALRSRENSFAANWHARLAPLKANGNIAVWGAGAKGITFVNAVDRHSDWITCLIDINPAKQDRFTPVTAHPVRRPDHAVRDGIATIIIMNPNYRAEIEAALSRMGTCALLLDA